MGKTCYEHHLLGMMMSCCSPQSSGGPTAGCCAFLEQKNPPYDPLGDPLVPFRERIPEELEKRVRRKVPVPGCAFLLG